MLADLVERFTNLPDVPGEGAIFAFSGMDGETNTSSEFVATWGSEPYSLLFHTPARRTLYFEMTGEPRTRVVTGDVLGARTREGDLLVAFSAWHTLVGTLPEGTAVKLRLEDGPKARLVEALWVCEDPKGRDVLAGTQRGQQFALSYGADTAEARARAEQALRLDPYEVAAQRLAVYDRLPTLANAELDRLLRKCFSVMKVNTLSAEGAIRQHWSTPDRVPHQHMWLWDSVFHSLAMNRFDPELSWEFLKSVLDAQRDDGYIAHMMQVDGGVSHVTQPPLLAWGVWENHRAHRDKATLTRALPHLEAYLEWNLRQRDLNHNGLLEWAIGKHTRSRCGESGLDNSPRFDRGAPLDSVDFNAIQAHDMEHVAKIAAELGEAQKAESWAERAAALSRRIHELLWDEQDGFYYDRDMEGRFERCRAVSGFFPLMLADVPADRVDRLAEALNDPTRFAAVFPIPTVALDEPSYSTDMWRGATWCNTNYLVMHGLRRQGRDDEARDLADKTIQFVNKYYADSGVLFEFFDSSDQVPPHRCDRKGPCKPVYDIRKGYSCIRDYHWTAAVTALVLLGQGQVQEE